MKKIVIYTSDTCGYCVRAKALLKSKRWEYEEINLSHHPELIDDVRRRSGRRSVPQIFIGGEPVGGYQEIKALDDAGELDRLVAAS